MAGQEGFEPPTPGFGVRRSTVRATGLQVHSQSACCTHEKAVRPGLLLCFLVNRMLAAKPAVLFQLQFIRRGPLVLSGRVVLSLTLAARKRNDYPHLSALPFYSIISLTTPAPTVRPPSRMANRSSFSIAMGVISSAVIVTLSPGITISTFSGSVNIPVTSVVLK